MSGEKTGWSSVQLKREGSKAVLYADGQFLDCIDFCPGKTKTETDTCKQLGIDPLGPRVLLYGRLLDYTQDYYLWWGPDGIAPVPGYDGCQCIIFGAEPIPGMGTLVPGETCVVNSVGYLAAGPQGQGGDHEPKS